MISEGPSKPNQSVILCGKAGLRFQSTTGSDRFGGTMMT